MEDEDEGELVKELTRDWNNSYLERFWGIRAKVIEDFIYGNTRNTNLLNLLREFISLWNDIKKEYKDLAPALFGNIFEGLYTYSKFLISTPDLRVSALKPLAMDLLSLPLTAAHETDFVMRRFNEYSNDLRNKIINEDLKVLTNMVVSKSHYDLCDLGGVFREQINEWFLSAVVSYPGCRWLRTCDDFSGDDAIKCSVTKAALLGDSDSLDRLVMYLLSEITRNVNNPDKQELFNKFKRDLLDLVEYFSQLPIHKITSVEDLRKYGIPDMDLYTDRSLISIIFRGIHKNEVLLMILAYIMAARTLRARVAFILNYFNKYGCSYPKPIKIHEQLVKLLYSKSISDSFSAIYDICETKHDKEETKDEVRTEIDNYERIKPFLELYFYSLT